MKTTSLLRLTFAGAFLAILTLCAPMAHADCGGCNGGNKKNCPSPSPTPSPAK